MIEPVDGASNSIADEFLLQFPRKSVNELNVTAEDGIFIVMGQISSFVVGDKWWYPACPCHKSVTLEDGLYFCVSCASFVLGVTPRYRVEIEVSDGDDVASFVLFDSDFQNLIGKECKELVFARKNLLSDSVPEEFHTLIGRQLLFKVHKEVDHGSKFDGSFKVKKICGDKAVMDIFKDNGDVSTPSELVKKGKFPEMPISSSEFGGGISNESSEISEITPSVMGLDDISFGEESELSSSAHIGVGSVGSTSKRLKRHRVSIIKMEKE